RTPPQNELAVVFPPPPAPVVAPAPPGAPGVGRKEEHEVEFETESHDDQKHSFTAVRMHQRKDQEAIDRAWTMFGAALVLSLGGAAAAAVYRRRSVVPHHERVRRI
ncbi:MAG TPA: hypothetical protein VM841_05030, partial [Actinomycetota bacterium]|nr:hypothetical protein [Actinomycetota bacterium]